MSFIVAIDGPAGVGKGTIAKIVAEKFNLINIDTGAMYRAISYYLIQNNINLDEIEKIKEILDKIKIEIYFENDEQILYLNKTALIKELRIPEVNNIVSQVSHIPEVRQKMVLLQRDLANGRKIIMEGRDIGTNVFPNANVKIYLDATPEERANRRMKQNLEIGIQVSYEDILENIKFRDNNDKTSLIAPLKMAEDAIYIDCTNLGLEELSDKVFRIVAKSINKTNKN